MSISSRQSFASAVLDHAICSSECLQRLKAGAGSTPHNGLYGEALSDRGNFFRHREYKRGSHRGILVMRD